jgi:hypothetical protein
MLPSSRLRRCLVLAAFVVSAAVIAGTPIALAQTGSPSPGATPGPSTTDADDVVMLSGSVSIPRGQTVQEIVVLRGRVSVLGVALGDVVVLDGSITISGQVGGSVVALNGPSRLARSATVRGDVLGATTVRVEPGATVEGDVRESVAFTPRGSLEALGFLLGPIAIACSVLVLGLALLLLIPRGADRVATAARTAPLPSLGWGVLLSLLLPIVAVAATATIVGIPLGLSLLLGLALVFLVAFTWAVWSVGRAMVGEPRSRWLAFLAGWALAAILGSVPVLGPLVWGVGSVFGLGAMTVAAWRARGSGGRHRRGYVELPEAEPAAEANTPAATGGFLDA